MSHTAFDWRLFNTKRVCEADDCDELAVCNRLCHVHWSAQKGPITRCSDKNLGENVVSTHQLRCKRGHELNPETVGISPVSGHRSCLQCSAEKPDRRRPPRIRTYCSRGHLLEGNRLRTGQCAICRRALMTGQSLGPNYTHCMNGHLLEGDQKCKECAAAKAAILTKEPKPPKAPKVTKEPKQAKAPKLPTHCSFGHELSPENSQGGQCIRCFEVESAKRVAEKTKSTTCSNGHPWSENTYFAPKFDAHPRNRHLNNIIPTKSYCRR